MGYLKSTLENSRPAGDGALQNTMWYRTATTRPATKMVAYQPLAPDLKRRLDPERWTTTDEGQDSQRLYMHTIAQVVTFSIILISFSLLDGCLRMRKPEADVATTILGVLITRLGSILSTIIGFPLCRMLIRFLDRRMGGEPYPHPLYQTTWCVLFGMLCSSIVGSIHTYCA